MTFYEESFKILNNLVVDDNFKVSYDFFKMKDVKDQDIKKGSNCEHRNYILENQTRVCMECGVMIEKDISYEKEWRYYGMMDTKHNSDPNRCNIRKCEDKSIFKDVEKMGFTDKIISQANTIYEQVTNNKIFRGNTRKGIIFACIFHAYKVLNNPQSCEQLIEIFEINRKIALKGLKYVNLNIEKESPFRGFQINTEHLIREIMTKFNATEKQIEEVQKIYEFIKDKSVLLNRSRPQSVACGLVRYYTLKKNPEITIDYFRSKIHLSELTINNIVREIIRLLDE
jgi:transcription initiation factor TFIIIB Brf1 subunit/transcription initiation factor TFIIB